MIHPPPPPNEEQRLQALRETCLLDTPIEKRFERITQLAQQMLDVPIAAISLVDADRQWFKSIRGLDTRQTSRQVAFCAHTIVDRELQVVPDARIADRYRDNPLVTGGPGIVFYADQPIYAENGTCLGSLCIIDRRKRTLSAYQTKVLGDLARLAEQEIHDPRDETGLRDFLRGLDPHQLPSLVDPTTHLWNRTGTEAVLDFILDKMRGTGKMVGLLKVTLDAPGTMGLGSQTMVAARRAVAGHLMNGVRPQDLIGDLGGGRFAVIVRNGDPGTETVRFAERIERVLGMAHIETPDGPCPLRATTTMDLYMPTALTRAARILGGAGDASGGLDHNQVA